MLKNNVILLTVLLLNTVYLLNTKPPEKKRRLSPTKRLTRLLKNRSDERAEKRKSPFPCGFESALASVQEAQEQRARTKETWWPALHDAIKKEDISALSSLLNIEKPTSSSSSSSIDNDARIQLRNELRPDFSLVNESNREEDEFPLMLAARYGKDRVVRWLLAHHADPNKANTVGDTALHEAAWQGNMATIRVLVEAGAHTDLPNVYGNTPLHRAVLALSPSPKTIAYLVHSRSDMVHEKNCTGSSPLDYAKGDKKIINALLSGESVYQRLKPLDQARSPEITGLEATALPLSPDISIDSCLYNALKSKELDVALHCIEHGANPNMTDDNGNTLLHLSAKQQTIDYIRELYKKGYRINPNITNKDGETVLHILARVPHFKGAGTIAASLLRTDDPTRIPANLFMRCHKKTPLEIAVGQRNRVMMRKFLSCISDRVISNVPGGLR